MSSSTSKTLNHVTLPPPPPLYNHHYRSTIPISFLHQRIHNISISTEHEDPETNTTDNQNPETNPNPNSIPANDPPQFQISQNYIPPIPYPITPPPTPQCTMAFSSAEEAAAERRRRKRRLRIEPPLHALRLDPSFDFIAVTHLKIRKFDSFHSLNQSYVSNICSVSSISLNRRCCCFLPAEQQRWMRKF